MEKQEKEAKFFNDLGLDDKVLKAIKKQGYKTPTPIQEKLIPFAIEGRDVLGSAETGSGKTAAFILPVIEHILERGGSGLRCLILEPTRELAIQVRDVSLALSEFTDINSVVIFGGVPAANQISKIRAGVDILIATPGRLYDLAWQGIVNFENVTHLVVDEVDRMLDMGFIQDIERIVSFLPRREYQKMFFSATLTPDVNRQISKMLVDPKKIIIGKRSKPAEGITHEIYLVARKNKTELLAKILRKKKMDSAIIFTETKNTTDRLAKELKKKNFSVSPFHSGYSQVARYDRLEAFRRGSIKILVATNVAARGLDITGISHVFNYDVPPLAEDYVHRIGRSARADATGVAITLVAPDEARSLADIERLIEMKLPRVKFEDLTLDDLKAAPRRSAPRDRGRGDGDKPYKRNKYSGKKKGGFSGKSGKSGRSPRTRNK